MTISLYISAIASTFFRIIAFIFLRVVPARAGKVLLPALYTIYLASFVASLRNCSSQVKPCPTPSASVDEKRVKSESPNSTINAISQKDSNPILALVFNLPNQSKCLRYISFIVNAILIVFTLDLIIQPALNPAHDVIFARVGAVDSDSVKIIVRYPQLNATESHVKVMYRPASGIGVSNAEDEIWKSGPVIHLTEEKDWVNTERIKGLWPSTVYEYKLASSNATLEFLPYPPSALRFRTFPDPRLLTGSHFRFVVTSCAMQNFPYVPGRSGRIKGFDLLSEYLWPETRKTAANSELSSGIQSENTNKKGRNTGTIFSTDTQVQPQTDNGLFTIGQPANETFGQAPYTILSSSSTVSPWSAASMSPAISSKRRTPLSSSTPMAEFLLFLGDFIYADVPYYYGDNKEAYQRLYRRNYASRSFRKVYERLPVLHIYDDHEILNNFAGLSNDSTPPFPNASSAFETYNGQANYDSVDRGEYYYNFQYGDVAFFVMDTRRHRSNLTEGNLESHTMLGEKQVTALHTWLSKVNQTATFKFIVSSVPFTSLWQYDALTDSWAAFAAEKASILKSIHSVPNVIVLSGDRHEFAAIQFNGPSVTSHTVLEFSTSPLSMFYIPFIRTLNKESTNYVEKFTTKQILNSEGIEEVHQDVELVPEEKVLKYIATGNYKWSSIEIDTRDSERPFAHLEVMIDGRTAYRLSIAGTPVKLRSTTALGAFVPQSFKEILDKIGLKPSKWF